MDARSFQNLLIGALKDMIPDTTWIVRSVIIGLVVCCGFLPAIVVARPKRSEYPANNEKSWWFV
jgi:hypothetical protein